MSDPVPSTDRLAGTLWTGHERDACGTGFIARRDGVATREVVALALRAVERLAHRGAVGAADFGAGQPTGDGAGVLTQVPWRLLARELPVLRGREPGTTGVAMCFLPTGDEHVERDARELVERALAFSGVEPLAWRTVPIDPDAIGGDARATCPAIVQLFVARPERCDSEDSFERLLYRVRRRIELAARDAGIRHLYVPSFSCRTVVYKGLLVAAQLRTFFPDLDDEDFVSSLAVFHQRYSTNTFPTWERAQPCRMIAHNGEINTLRGNVAWMRAREGGLDALPFATPSDDPSWLRPAIDERGSDSAMLDNAVELVVRAGRSVPHALTMLVPPAWDKVPDLDERARDMLSWHAGISEPWDGPAAISFTDGVEVGACLDRNGLRPARWLVTGDGLVGCSSEAGSIEVEPARIVHSGKLGPGEMLVVDTVANTLREGDQVVEQLAASQPWDELLAQCRIDVEGGSVEHDEADMPDPGRLVACQAAFGYTREELTTVLRPMLVTALEAVGSMGDDTPIGALTQLPRTLFGNFRQQFAEVTNPPIDPIRERTSMSLHTLLGPRARLLHPESPEPAVVQLASPVLTSAGLDRVRQAAGAAGMQVATIDLCVRPSADDDLPDLRDAVASLCVAAAAAVADGCSILVLSDRGVAEGDATVPSLLATSAVHHHLVDAGLRLRCGIVVDSGEPREVHHVAALVGHGANAVCPWLLLDSTIDIATGARSPMELPPHDAQQRVVAALDAGLLKTMSKMGIATVDGYCGAQVFEAVGLTRELAVSCFPGTLCRTGSTGFEQLEAEAARRLAHARDWWRVLQRAEVGDDADAPAPPPLPSPGFYKFKRDGEAHAYNPAMVKALHAAVEAAEEAGDWRAGLEQYGAYLELVRGLPDVDPRDLLELAPPAAPAQPVPLDEVEPVEAIVRRFSTGAMSHGSLSSEAHETLAEAMNLLGAASNSGEGGEHHGRYGTGRNSAIKQVASARFGVTPAYLRSARELQIKMAQGSKPGEGGHLPGHKVTEEIAAIRHTVPGVDLISPPPHHDIYSIEDLAQLVHDLSSVNPHAAISVKLVSQAGVGTIAAGVVKARADAVLISGAAGGTGASPLGSIKHAGMPWEWGLAETQQVLIANGLRGRVRLRVDGGFRTGRDVLVAALLGADEFSFGTAALIAEGCTMARTCHNDKCPVGIATQRLDLRAKYPGTAARVAAFLQLVANEVREMLASVGARSLDEAIGRVDLLRVRDGAHALDLAPLLAEPDVPEGSPRRWVGESNAIPFIEEGLDARVAREVGEELARVAAAGSGGDETVARSYRVENVDRSVCARLAGDRAAAGQDGGAPLPDVHLRFRGSAGQSFGAFAGAGMRIDLEGEANDFVGKGLAGGVVAVRFDRDSPIAGREGNDVLAGNACLYGATAGRLFVAGRVGERFAVRNSGASAVVEAVGDHGCEYMTGGTVVVLGRVGRNFAAGMTGGVAYVLDDDGVLEARLDGRLATIDQPACDELDEVRELVELHEACTGSSRAAKLLADWPAAAARLRRVRPTALVVAAGAPAGI